MASKTLQAAISEYDAYIKQNGITENVIEAYVHASKVAYHEKDYEYARAISGKAKDMIYKYLKAETDGTPWELEKYCWANKTSYSILDTYFDLLKVEAQNKIFDSYLLYLERKREPRERFYAPKRDQFAKFGIIEAYQGCIDDKYDRLCISLPPGTGKTTLLKFFNSAIIGWFPKDYNLFYSHSSDITRMYYDGVYQMCSDTQEYAWGELFPKLKITGTNAKMQQFNVGKYKPFPSLQTASVGSENAGKVRASKYLLVDDMIGKLEEALNKNTLEKLWGAYTVDARQRKTMDSNDQPCKEVIQATRWSTMDVIGRIMNMYDGDPRTKIVAVPDTDPVTGESNFDYEYGGFTKEFFADQALLMDDISYRCLYKQEPVEREGRLYVEEELRRYTSLPDREPDAILGVCDTKTSGVDYMVLPVMYQYDNDYYLVDCVCDDSTDFERQYRQLSDIIVEHKMQQCEFESNVGGNRLAYDISSLVEKKGGSCNITTKYTETNKETRIIVNSDWVKKHVLFKVKENYAPKSDYGKFMSQMLSWSTVGRNKHDDVVDCLANFRLYVQRKERVKRAVVVESFW